MLQAIRDRSQGIFAWVLIIILCAIFGLWGISNYLQSNNSDDAVVKVNDAKISKRQLSAQYDRLRRELQVKLGRNFHISEELSVKLKKQALQQLIQGQVISDYALSHGYVVPMEAIQSFILTNPGFEIEGKFSRARFSQFISELYPSEQAFIHELRTIMLANQIQTGIGLSAFVLPTELNNLVQLIFQTRSFEVTTIKASEFAKQVKVSDAQVQKYYEAQQADFKLPEKVKLQYVEISLKSLEAKAQKEIEQRPEVLKTFYHNNINDFTAPPKWEVAHILVKAAKAGNQKAEAAVQAKLEGLESKLKAGADFAKLAKADSADVISARKGGVLGWFGPKDLDPAFVKAVMKMKVGQISKPVKTKFGFSIIKLLDKKSQSIKPFAKVKAQVLALLAKQQAQKTFSNVREELANLTYEQPTTLKPAAKTLDLKIQETPFFDRNGAPKGLASSRLVQKAAFSDEVLGQGNNSDVISVENNTAMVVIRVLKHQAATTEKLDVVKPDIVRKLSMQAEAKLAKAKGQALLKKLSGNANADGVKWKRYNEIKRTTTNVPTDVLNFVFKMHHPATGQSRYAGFSDKEGNYVVVKLNQIAEHTEKVEKNNREMLGFAHELANSYGQMVSRAIVDDMMAKAKIKHYS